VTQAARTSTAERRARLQWPDVLRAVPSPKTRERALDAYRAAGFTPDDFAAKRAAREAMADALSRTEQWLELAPENASRAAGRAAIRAVRRRLEFELWP